MSTRIPILTFHSIDDDGSVLSFSPARFENILTKLRRKGFKTISLRDVVDWINGQKLFDTPVIVITFDDGFENLYYSAFPLLEEFGYKATIFLTAGYCGLKNNWPSQPHGIPVKPILKWDQVREMSKSVFEIQAHSINHPNLLQEPSEVIEKEIIGSKMMIEDKIGNRVDFFAYPYGHYNDLVYNSVSGYYKGACSAELDFTHYSSDCYRLERIDMYYFAFGMTMGLFLTPMFIPYLWFRKFLRIARKAIGV